MFRRVGVLFLILQSLSGAGIALDNSTDEKRNIIQAMLDMPALRNYVHPETPERLPLTLVFDDISPAQTLEAYGRSVHIVSNAEISNFPGHAFLRILQVKVENGRAEVKAEYPVEGIYLEVHLKNVNGKWVEKNYSIIER